MSSELILDGQWCYSLDGKNLYFDTTETGVGVEISPKLQNKLELEVPYTLRICHDPTGMLLGSWYSTDRYLVFSDLHNVKGKDVFSYYIELDASQHTLDTTRTYYLHVEKSRPKTCP